MRPPTCRVQALKGRKNSQWRESVYYRCYQPSSVAVRSKTHKLVAWGQQQDCWQLFDLKRDPAELVDQYNNPEYASIRDELLKQMTNWQDHYEDPNKLKEPNDQKKLPIPLDDP